MKFSSVGNSMIEVMVVMLVVSTGIIGSYQIVSSGQKLATTTQNRIKAVNFAREGLEIVENIRDTNWLKFSSDYRGCFDTLGYDVNCIGSATGVVVGVNRIYQGSYIVSTTADWAWSLTNIPTPAAYDTARVAYLGQFPLYLDANGLSTQTGTIPSANCSSVTQRNCNTKFSREIRITRPADFSSINVESIVTWTDPSRNAPFVIDLKYDLQNWKYAFTK